MLSKVFEALKALPDLPVVTVSEVKGFNKSQAADATQKVLDEEIEYGKNIKLEIVVSENRADEAF